MQRFDLHIHTSFSKDSLIDPRVLPRLASSRGLAGFAITDHNTFGAHIGLKSGGIIIVPGMEIKTITGDIIVLFIQEPIHSRDPFEVLDRVKAQDGLSIAAHPFGFPRMRGKMDKRVLGLVDGIEVMNARNLVGRQNEKALKLARRFGKAETGGSDAHTPYEVGRAYTLADALSQEELRLAIKKGMTRGVGRLSFPFVHFASFATGLIHL